MKGPVIHNQKIFALPRPSLQRVIDDKNKILKNLKISKVKFFRILNEGANHHISRTLKGAATESLFL